MADGGEAVRKFNQVRLKEIRVVRKLTLENVASWLGVTKQMVSKYETGVSIPQLETIVKLSELFQVPADYFTKPSTANKSSLSPLFFRTTSNTTNKEIEAARVTNYWNYEIIDCVDRLWGLPKANLPELNEVSSVEQKTQALREFWGLNNEPIEDLIYLLETNGIYVTFISSTALKIDGYSQIINKTPIIVINKDRGSASRQRFSIAHELGHIILHQNISETEYKRNQKEYEKQAQEFASCLLLPPSGFNPMISSSDLNSLIQLKKCWNVSIQAIIYRCIDKNLLLASEAERTRNRMMREWGGKTEPCDDEIQFEKPSILAKAVSEHILDNETYDAFYAEVSLPISAIKSVIGVGCDFWNDYYSMDYELSADSYLVGNNNYRQLSLFDLEGFEV